MKAIRRIKDDRAGFLKDVSEIIALEAWKDPSLIPDLSSEKTIFLFSDYSQPTRHYSTYSFYLFGRSGADYFNGAREVLRREFGLGRRRMSFKQMNDRIKLRALTSFLDIAGAIDGILLTFAVDGRIPFMFADQFLQVDQEFFSPLKKPVLEEMLRVVHFGAQALMTALSPGQNIVWFSDRDSILANERCEQLFGKVAETTIRHQYLRGEPIGSIQFGSTSIDDGSLELEDLASVPDLVAGALRETLGKLAETKVRVASKVVLSRPRVSRKTDLICQWLSRSQCPLQKFSIVFNRTGSGVFDWAPTFFSIRNETLIPPGTCYGGQRRACSVSIPIRFDVQNS